MRTVIKLEMFAMYEKHPPKYMSGNKSQPYVARLNGTGSEGEFSKVFIHGYLDYSKSNSKGSRGIYKTYFLDDGLYEVFERVTWQRSRMYYLMIANGQKTEMTLEEAYQWLEQKEKNISA
jgi:hypothetical protein